jgi:transposase InsO family protein
VSDKYTFIVAEYAANKAASAANAPTIEKMCVWTGVSKSGFFEWRDRPPSVLWKRHDMLKRKIQTIFTGSEETYGYRRIHAALLRAGERVSDELVRRLMRVLGLVPCQVRKPRSLTKQAAGVAAIPDLVRRDFTAATPGTKLIGDITEIKTWEGKVYLATIIDCFNKEVIGYAMADHYRTELITAAIAMATDNHTLAPGCIAHSDRGSNYTSHEYAKTLADCGLRQSLGRTGICYDNAAAESFFATLKKERVYRTVYPTRKKAMTDVARYIELFYNRRRLHTANGYRPPHEARIEYLKLQEAA